jgi:hypothetical protein
MKGIDSRRLKDYRNPMQRQTRRSRSVLACTLVVLFFALSVNAYACLLPVNGVEASEMETDCATSAKQPFSQICDEFKTLRVQSADPFQLDSGFQTICSEDTATLALDAIHTLPGNRLSEHPIVGPLQDLLLKISVLRI